MAAVQLPTLVQNIVLNPVGVKKGATAITKGMKPVQAATNAATASTMKMGQSLNTLGFRAQTFGRTLMKFVVLPMGALAAVSLKSFSSFEASFAKIEALVGVAGGAVERFKTNVKGISKATGRAPQELAEAMFFITSAGLRAGTAVDVLNASAKAAAVGLGSTKVVADAATSAVNAYGAENLSGGLAVDVLTAAVREGKVEADRLAPAIGKAIPVASAMGVEFHEVAAAIAAMTRTGTDARTSAIQLRQIMQSLLDPSRQATKAMKEMGIAEGELRDMARTDGLLAVLKRLRDLSEENADAFADVFPNIRALAGALDITGANLEENEQIFKALANSAGDTDKALEITAKTAAHKMAVAMAELKVAFLELGEALLPIIGILQGVIGALTWLINTIANAGWLTGFIVAVVTVGAVLATLLIAFGSVATSIAFKAQAMEYLTLKTAENTVATTTNTAAQTGNAAATTAAGSAAAVGARGLKIMTGGLRLLSKAFVPLLIIGTVITLFSFFGKKAKSATKEVNELKDAIKDVRNFGDVVLSDPGGIGNIFTGYFEQKGSMSRVSDFKDAFDEQIQAAFEEGGGDAAQSAFQLALIDSFHGQGDSAEVRGAIELLVAQYARQFGDTDMWTDIFEGQNVHGSVDEAITGFLTGVVSGDSGASDKNIETALRARVQAEMSDVAGNVIGPALENLWEDSGVTSWGGAISTMNFDRKDEIVEATESFVGDLDDALRKGMVQDFAVLWDEFSTVLTDQVGPELAAQGLGLLLDELSQLGAFTDGNKTLFETLQELANTEWDDLPDGISVSLTGTENERFGGLAERTMLAFQDLQTMLAMDASTGGNLASSFMVGGKPLEERLKDTSIEMLAIELAIERVGASANAEFADVADGLSTVDDILTDLDQAFAQADAAAKRFNKTFDNFIGRPMSLEQAKISWIDGLNDMSDVITDNDGILNNNARSAIFDQIEELNDLVQSLFETGRGEEAEGTLVRGFEEIKRVAELAGIGVEELEHLYSEIGVTSDAIALSAMSEQDALNTTVSEAFETRMDHVLETGASYAELTGSALGTSFIEGIAAGVNSEGMQVTHAILGELNLSKEEIMRIYGISSPSKVFAVEVGQPITAGIAKGILDGKQGLKNVIREVVEDAMDTAQTAVGAASNAITSVFDFGEAQRKLDRLMVTAGGKGVDTKWEKLNRRKLERAVEEAKRNLFLGAGNQEDLEIALMEAEFALEDFDTKADVGRDVVDAELELADAGLKVATATAEMKMEGDEAVETFRALAEAVGLSGDQISNLLDLSEGDEAMMGDIFSPDTVQAVKDVAAGLGWISTATGDGPPTDIGLPVTGGDASQAVGMWTSDLMGQGGMTSQIAAQLGETLTTWDPFADTDWGAIAATWEAQRFMLSPDNRRSDDNNPFESGFIINGDLNISMEGDDVNPSSVVATVSNNVDTGDPSGGGRYGSGGGGRKGHPLSGRG